MLSKISGSRWLLAALILMSGPLVYGQTRYGLVTGNAKPINGATIKNLKSKKQTISGSEGAFMIAVNKGDTLLTSYPGLKPDTFVYNNQPSLLIVLRSSATILGVVVIRDSRNNPEKKLKKAQSDYKQIYRIGDDKDWLEIGFGFAINIQKLYNHFSREGKNARRLQRTIIRDYYDDVVDSRFTKSLVTKYTGYEGKQLDEFMIANRPTYDFIKHASTYDVIEYILKAKKASPPASAAAFIQDAK